jgi:hypothetical protein
MRSSLIPQEVILMRKRRLLHVAALVAVVIGVRSANADSIIYVAGQGNEFGTLDLTTGNFNQIGTFNLPSSNITGMGFGANGSLYGLDSSQPNANLYQINTTNANATLIGGINESAAAATADAAGTLYALSSTYGSAVFYTMNPATTGTTTTTVGSIGTFSAGLIAVNASGMIYTTAYNPTTSQYDLFSIDPTTAAATEIGGVPYIVSGLFVGNTLYGFDPYNDVFTINTSTGVATQVGTYDLNSEDGITAAALMPSLSVPEPASIALGLIAILAGACAGVFRRRPKRPAV